MFDSASRSDGPAAAAAMPASVRSDSELAACFVADGNRTQLGRLFERGALRLRLPRANGRREAVIVNTGGGIAGGDRTSLDLDVGPDARAVVTSQAAEKIYRSDGPCAQIEISMRLAARSTLDWLPQETILFDRCAVERRLDVEMDSSARLTLLECVVLGRVAHGEELRQVHWRDRWRVRRGGTLAFADTVRLSGDAASLMERPAVGRGAKAIATLLYVGADAEGRLQAVRTTLERTGFACGASAWNGMLIARFAAADALALRNRLIQAATAATGRAMPRAWSC